MDNIQVAQTLSQWENSVLIWMKEQPCPLCPCIPDEFNQWLRDLSPSIIHPSVCPRVVSDLCFAGELLYKVEASLNASRVQPENAPKKGNGAFSHTLAQARKLVASGWARRFKDLPRFTVPNTTVAGAGSEPKVRQWVGRVLALSHPVVFFDTETDTSLPPPRMAHVIQLSALGVPQVLVIQTQHCFVGDVLSHLFSADVKFVNHEGSHDIEMIRARFPDRSFPAINSVQLAPFIQQCDRLRWVHRCPSSGVPSLQALVAEYLERHLLKDDGPSAHVGWANATLTEAQKACKSNYFH